MRRSTLRLYGPFLALALVQALFIVASPSKAPDRTALSAGGAGGNRAGSGTSGFASTGASGTGTSDVGGTGSAATGGGGSVGGGGGGGATSNVGGGGLAAGDTSHCAGPYQFDVLLSHGPPCQPAFGGDNGGATAEGVSGDEIKVIIFQAKPNEQVNAILKLKGLATTVEEEDAAIAAYKSFINTHYELYGRKITFDKVIGDCPTTPPDYQKCEVAAQEVVKAHPFMVIWITSLYADVFDIWANAGIVSVGGSAFDANYYNGRRPYRYDAGMDGTQSADFISSYYCNKLAGKAPDHAGTNIHATIGPRNTPGLVRKLGVIVPEIPANTITAQRVIDAVRACGGPNAAVDHPFTYKSDINSATTQTESTVASLATNKVTTVVCMCDPIAPVFLTTGLSNQAYYPEHVLPGIGLLDYDLLGQLYDKQQWQHAFGPSQLPTFGPLDDSDAGRAWRAAGNNGHPCGNNGCGLDWAFMSTAALMLQQTGPNLNALTFEQGVLGNIPPFGGAGRVALTKFGPDDYTAESDEKEVYWDPLATTPIDGSQGAYITVGPNCPNPQPHTCEQRYELGQWSSDLSLIPVHS
ncbi:MAG: hypothetical protein QOI95_1889 [Acidimicrobiaceae bacterium]|jgi:hypothetical protein